MILTGNANDWMHALLSLLSCVPLSLIGQASTKNVQNYQSQPPCSLDHELKALISRCIWTRSWAHVPLRNLCHLCERHMRKKDCRRYSQLTEAMRKEIAQLSLEERSAFEDARKELFHTQRMADLVADAVAKKLRSMDVDWTFVSWNVYRCRDLNFHCSAKSSWLSFTDCVWTVLPDKHRGEAMRKKKFEHCGMSCASSRMLQTIGKLQFCFQPVLSLSLYLFPSFFSG